MSSYNNFFCLDAPAACIHELIDYVYLYRARIFIYFKFNRKRAQKFQWVEQILFRHFQGGRFFKRSFILHNLAVRAKGAQSPEKLVYFSRFLYGKNISVSFLKIAIDIVTADKLFKFFHSVKLRLII